MNVQEEAQEIRRLWSSFMSSRVLLTANNLRVFEHLRMKTTAGQAAESVGADGRAMEILLDALASLGLVKKSGDAYQNTAITERFLVEGTPYYQGDIIRHADTLWQSWSGLDEVVRTGRPNRKAHDHGSFIRGMHNLAILKAQKVAKAIDLKGVKKALDLGGGPGTYTLEFARKGVAVTLFDLPATVAIARELIQRAGMTNVQFMGGDFLADDIGSGYDLIFVSQIIHSLSATQSVELLRKCKEVLNPEGKIAVQEFYINDNRAFPPQSALFSVNMLVNTDEGRCYPPAEIKGFLGQIGFAYIRDKVIDDTVLVTGLNRG